MAFVIDSPLFSRGQRKKNLLLKEQDIRSKVQAQKDLVSEYISSNVNKFVYKGLSEAFVKNTKLPDDLVNLRVPLRLEDVDLFEKNQLSPNIIGENIAMFLGMDSKLRSKDLYIIFIRTFFGNKAERMLFKKAKYYARYGYFSDALITYKSGFIIQPDSLDCLYGYAKVCRQLFLSGENLSKDEAIFDWSKKIDKKVFGKEAINYFSLINNIYPKFADAYYFLGYMFLDTGQYEAADKAWENYIRTSKTRKDRREIRNRRNQIQPILNIEIGINLVKKERFIDAISILQPFAESKFNDWWPLYYYLGIAYKMINDSEKAR
ncbi:MAG: hypothetical protein LBD41_00115, partial [Clostridiales Family XIII bacterium]|nr:hypothetical protein [Clostridiales Family XIII bacterium]